MRKLSFVLSALALSIIMLVPIAMPVTAAGPAEKYNEPLCWINAASNTNNSPDWHYAYALTVKLLSNGTTVGNVAIHDWSSNEITLGRSFGNTFDQSETYFDEGQVSFIVNLHRELDGKNYKLKMVFIDSGEPGENDRQQFWIWLPDWGKPNEMWWPILGGWWGATVPIANGNVQVHLQNR